MRTRLRQPLPCLGNNKAPSRTSATVRPSTPEIAWHRAWLKHNHSKTSHTASTSFRTIHCGTTLTQRWSSVSIILSSGGMPTHRDGEWRSAPQWRISDEVRSVLVLPRLRHAVEERKGNAVGITQSPQRHLLWPCRALKYRFYLQCRTMGSTIQQSKKKKSHGWE